jgi:hypothetical protein
MSIMHERLALRCAPRILSLALRLVVMGSAIAAAGSAEAASEAVRCKIQVKDRAGGVSLEGVVNSETAIDGSYQLEVTKTGGGGGSNINQSGGFSTLPGRDTSIGIVMFGSEGGSYTATLKVKWDGSSTECRERVPGGH